MKVLDTDSFRDEEYIADAVGLGVIDGWVSRNLVFSVSNFPFGDYSFVRLA